MTPQDERLSHILPKLRRAEKHLGDLDAAIKQFVAAEPYRSVVESDPETGECVLRIAKIEPLPVDLSLIAGDAIQNLMSALDHLAYQLVCTSSPGGKPPNPKWIYFPVGNDALDYETKRDGKIKGARQDILDEIDLIEPYKGGKGDKIWTLYQLNNVEKHRLLFTVAATLSHWDFAPPDWGAMLIEEESGAKFPVKSWTVHVAEPKPLQEGDELFRFPCKSKLNEYAQFKVGIALCEPEIIPIQWLATLILESGKEVEKVVSRLARFL